MHNVLFMTSKKANNFCCDMLHKKQNIHKYLSEKF